MSKQYGQRDLGFKIAAGDSGPVECLGQTFENDAVRREHYLGLLAEKLKDPEFRSTPGVPKGTDETILRLSDPPYYTACPNPFLADVLSNASEAPRESKTSIPYVGDFVVDKRDPVYLYHPYHTKVPPDVIATLISHYTKPGDVVLDVFGGSGMTGVAAAMTKRLGLVADLSPVASLISAVNTSCHPYKFVAEEMRDILADSRSELGWLFETVERGQTIEVDYYVRSDVFTCPTCVHEFSFFPHGVIHHGNKVETRKSFPCPHCDAALNVRSVNRVLVAEGKKASLAWVKAGRGKAAIGRPANDHDQKVHEQAAQVTNQNWYPTDSINPDGYSAKLAQLGAKRIDDVSRLLSPRNLIVFSDLWRRVCQKEDAAVRRALVSILTSSFTVISERQGYFGGGGGMSGNMYMPIVRMERNPWMSVERKIAKFEKAERHKATWGVRSFVSCQSATHLQNVPSRSVDYIYTDPPFGANIIYSEMNRILEGWLQVLTEERDEAVVDETRSRDELEYGSLMETSFAECFRVLRPGCWITVEFHNTKASIWNVIQTSLSRAGFVVAQVGVLNKGTTTILADIRPGAAKHDLLIHAYKPANSLFVDQGRGLQESGVESALSFAREHLSRVPVHGKDCQTDSNEASVVAERLPHYLFDRYLSFHVSQGMSIPLSAAEFLEGLSIHLPQRDGMYFLDEQVAVYDRWRARIDKVVQLDLFVSDEASAVRWIRQKLQDKPQSSQDLQPQFMQQIQGWAKHEETIELKELLDLNFLCYRGQGQVPSQIHRYLSTNFRNMRNLEKEDPALMEKAMDRWYVPDPNKEGDLEKVRMRTHLKEFEAYRASTARKIKQFRTEAVRAGFKHCYDEGDYQTIVDVAAKLPDQVIQEDEKLLMYYDVATMRLGM